MRKLSLNNPEIMDILNHQVIHMDQGITYSPEYLVTRNMRYYPSRVAQIIRAVYLGELSVSECGINTVFTPILSGQGERWQNFGENQNGYLLSVVLGRELFANAGGKKKELDELKNRIKENGGHYLPIEEEKVAPWKEELPILAKCKTVLCLDEETYSLGGKMPERIGAFLKKKGIEVRENFGPYFTGFDLLAAGLIEEATAVIETQLKNWEEEGVTKVITLTGQSQYVYTTLAHYLGLETEIEFISILDLADAMKTENAYIYGGSFFTRYLRMDKKINEMTKNTKEEKIPTCPEFIPEVAGDKRRNVVGIWTPPLTAEYHPVGMPEGFEKAIYDKSLSMISNANFGTMVVCDPFAYKALIANGYPVHKLIYFAEVLV